MPSAESGLRRAVEVIQSGVIGKPLELHVWTNRPIWPQGQDAPACLLVHEFLLETVRLDLRAHSNTSPFCHRRNRRIAVRASQSRPSPTTPIAIIPAKTMSGRTMSRASMIM